MGGGCVVHIEGPDDAPRRVTSRLQPANEPSLASTRTQDLRLPTLPDSQATEARRVTRRCVHEAVLPPGRSVLTVEAEGCKPLRREFLVEAGREVAVTVALERD